MSTFPKITYIYDRRKTASAKTSAAVEMRIAFQNRQKYISTGIQLYPKQWKNNTITGMPDAQQLNLQLEQLLIDVRQVLMDMQREGNINIFDVPRRLEKLRNSNISLYDFLRQRTDIKKYGKSSDTQKRYERFLRLFREYGKIKSFDDITDNSIIAYDEYLSSTGMKPNSKWHNYHRFLNSFITDAIDAGFMKRNPYKWINIDKGKEEGLSKFLTLKEFRKIKKVRLPTESLEKVRDVFVFQTYTCLSYIDLAEFNPKAIVSIKGMKVYTGNREKTTKGFTIPLLPEAIRILEKYDYKLPVISNVNYNQYLKLVAVNTN